MKNKATPNDDSYYDLVRRFPLVPIRSEGEYDRAVAFLRPLAVRDEETLNAGEKSYLDALTQFVGDYEDRHLRSEMGRVRRKKKRFSSTKSGD